MCRGQQSSGGGWAGWYPSPPREAEEVQTSHPSASFPLCFCGPSCPLPTVPSPTSDPTSSPVRFSFLSWDPMQAAEAAVSSFHHLFSSSLLFHHLHGTLCQIPSGWCSQFPTGDKVRNGTNCRTHFSLVDDTPKQGCEWYWCYSRFVLVYLRSKFDMSEPPIELCIEILRITL